MGLAADACGAVLHRWRGGVRGVRRLRMGVRMNAPKFTPGPWAVGFSDGSGETYITAGDHPAQKDYPVIIVSGADDGWGISQGVRNPADAALIAAAPELYSELAKLVAKIGNDEPVSSFDLQDARTALAKAAQP